MTKRAPSRLPWVDEHRPGTVQYDDAHGLYVRKGRLRVVSPGDRVPRHAVRLGSVAHPGVTRDMLTAKIPPRVVALAALGARGATGRVDEGVDISEHQSFTPDAAFYVIRLLNENGREDLRWRFHRQNIAGRPVGAYGIIQPWNIDPGEWARRFVNLLAVANTNIVPTIDIELGDPAACRTYTQTILAVMSGAGIPVRMGYYSAGSRYRQQCQDLFHFQWLAAWGGTWPAGADLWQYQGSPLDLDRTGVLDELGGPPPAPPKPKFWRWGEEASL